jgi:penicillin-binding protein 1C
MKSHRLRRAMLWTVALLSTACVFGVVAFEIAIRIVPLPVELLPGARATVTLADRSGHLLAELASKEARSQRPVPLDEMGPWLPLATVGLEDHRFYVHSGIDIRSSCAAFIRNLRARRVISGGSTITQQLIKLASARSGKDIRSKLYEYLAAVRLERLWSKRRILQEYLNRSNYGNRLVGPAAAAQAYFNKTPANLTISEAIYLAGLPQAPGRYNPWRHPKAAAARYRRSVARLGRIGALNSAQLPKSLTPPPLAPENRPKRLAPHFVDLVVKQNPRLGGGVVTTTLDLEMQRYAEQVLELHLSRLASRRVSQGALVIIDVKTGDVCAMVGSRNYHNAQDGKINGCTEYRCCGSILKPFLYLRAIEDRQLTAASILPDTPDAVRAAYIDYDPVNFDKRFWGPVRVREALANSRNVPAVVALRRVGARRMFCALEDFGLKFARPFDEYGAGLILGNAEVRLLDLTAAYSVFAGDGLAVQPRLLEAEPIRHRHIASPEAVAIVADILADNDARQKTFGAASPLAFEDHRIPCKTGTSSAFRDAWTVGVTGEHAVGVWMGNFDGSPMDEIASVTGPAPLWHDIIEYLLRRGDSSSQPLLASERLRAIKVCSLTGLLPTLASPGVVREWFLAGTEPREDASSYFRKIDGVTRLILPGNYALWCHSLQNYLGAEVEPEARLRIVSPSPNSRFVIDPNMPRDQQALPLIALGAPAGRLLWKVDGNLIAQSNGRCYWTLTRGAHTVEVFSSTERAVATITVE